MLKAYIFLLISVGFEILGSTCLQASQQLTRFWPTVGVVIGYLGTVVFFAPVLKVLPLGVTYALWGGLGMVGVAVTGWFLFQQHLDAPALIGIGLILAGIVVINLFSATAQH